MKHFMEGNVDHFVVGLKLENDRFWAKDCSTDHRQDQSDSIKTSNYVESPKELHGCSEMRLRVRREGSRVLESISFQGNNSFL